MAKTLPSLFGKSYEDDFPQLYQFIQDEVQQPQLRISILDEDTGFLEDKLLEGSGITLTKAAVSDVETLTIAVDNSVLDLSYLRLDTANDPVSENLTLTKGLVVNEGGGVNIFRVETPINVNAFRTFINGAVGINRSAATSSLHIGSATAAFEVLKLTGIAGQTADFLLIETSGGSPLLNLDFLGNLQIASRGKWFSDGDLVLGGTTMTGTEKLNVKGSSLFSSNASFGTSDTIFVKTGSNHEPRLFIESFNSSRSATIFANLDSNVASRSPVYTFGRQDTGGFGLSVGYVMGIIDWLGFDGVDYSPGAIIKVTVDSAPTANSIPTKMELGVVQAAGTNPLIMLTLLTNATIQVDATLDLNTNDIVNAQVLRETTSISFADSPYTVLTSDSSIDVDASGGAVIINLYAISGNDGRTLTVSKRDSSANAVTIDGNGAETINGATTVVITAQYDTPWLRVNATEWELI